MSGRNTAVAYASSHVTIFFINALFKISQQKLRPVLEIICDRILNSSKSIATQLGSTKPPGNNNYVIEQLLSFQHPNNYHASARLSVVVLQRSSIR